jgi:hypothetical protein
MKDQEDLMSVKFKERLEKFARKVGAVYALRAAASIGYPVKPAPAAKKAKRKAQRAARKASRS